MSIYELRFPFTILIFIFALVKLPKSKMKEVCDYLIRFLLQCPSDSDLPSLVGYTSDESVFSRYKVVIIPSSFFDSDSYGKPSSIPKLPLTKTNGVSLLYGKDLIEKKGDTLLVHADIIASAFFVLSRYEEWVSEVPRDVHGRFLGKASILFKAGELARPIVDEYGRLLRNWLRQAGIDVPEPQAGISKIYLTHDVDEPFKYWGFRSVVSSLVRSLVHFNAEFLKALSTYIGKREDPWNVFERIIELNSCLKSKVAVNTDTVFFFKSIIQYAKEDKPCYSLFSKKIRLLFKLAQEHQVTIGLHSSYLAGDKPELIVKEKRQLEKAINQVVSMNRYHFLRSNNPLDMAYLEKAGIEDDFTISYPDFSGFKLGTSRPVRWINPVTKKVSSLKLHSLTMMDVTLMSNQYMNLNEEDAFLYAKQLIDETYKYAGELVLLWHNTQLSNENVIQLSLYKRILDYLRIKF